jgi:hypothetical protein
MAEDWLDSYRGGDRVRVWQAMLECPDVRNGDVLPQARAVARETMKRARQNVETLVARLDGLGYRFQNPEKAHVPPSDELVSRLDELERRIGPIPLSLRAFYEELGSVDFTQSTEQLVQWWPEEKRESAGELEILGEYDPLVVEPLDDEPQPSAYGPNWWFLALDEFHKANYSGGENYHAALPDSRADFPILGMYEIDEFFVPYLRATFAGGGFRGRVDADEERAWKVLPDLTITRELAAGLLEI